MISMLKKRLEKDEEGFTLIELMVVVLIIAILIAIAVPTFLGARENAQKRSAQSNARQALSTMKTYYTDEGSYSGMTDAATAVTELKEIEPGIKWVSAAPTKGSNEVQVAVGDTSTTVCAVTFADNNEYYAVADVSGTTNTGTWYYSGTAAPTCAAASMSGTGAQAGWSTSSF